MATKDIKYKPEYAIKLPEMFKSGEDVAEVCAALNISRATFYNWIKKYPEFEEAYSFAKTLSEAWWQKLGRAGACGKADINPAIWIFNMKSKFGMKETNVIEHTSGEKNIKIDVTAEMQKRGIPIPDIGMEDIED